MALLKIIKRDFCQLWADAKPVEVNGNPYSDLSCVSYPPENMSVLRGGCWIASLSHVKEEVNICESEQESKKFINQVSLPVMT